MDNLRHQKYQNKRLDNSFDKINISINDMNTLEEKELAKKRTLN